MSAFAGQRVLIPPSSITLTGCTSAGGNAQWTAPTIQGTILNYSYYVGTTSGGNEVKASTITTNTSTNAVSVALTANTNYYVSALTRNTSNGVSAVSTSGPLSFPGGATGLTLASFTVGAGSGAVTPSWTAPTGTAPSSYTVSVGTTSGGADVSAAATRTSGGAISSLTIASNTNYFLTVVALNAVGSTTVNGGVAVSTKPAAPTLSSFTCTATTITPTFTAPPGNATMTYSGVIGITSGGTEVTNGGTITSGANTYSIGSNNNVYLTMKASNAVDVSASSSTYGPVVSSVPPAPTLTSFTCTATTITPTFTASTGNVTTTYKAIIGITSGGSEVTNGGAITSGANTYSIGSNNFVYLTMYGNNSSGDGPVSTKYGPVISSAPPAPSVSATQANVTQTTTGSITLSAAGNANCNSAFKVLIDTTSGGSNLYSNTGLSSGFTPTSWSAVGSNNLIYVTAYASNANGFGSSTVVSYPSSTPPAPTYSTITGTGTSITASTLSATGLSVTGTGGATSYRVSIADAASGGNTLQTETTFTSGMSVTWGCNRADYVTFKASNAAGVGVAMTPVYLANWAVVQPTVSFSAYTAGATTITGSNTATQPTSNGLSYLAIAGNTSGGSNFLNSTIAGTSGNRTGFTNTIDFSSYARRPFTLYYSVTAYAGSTKSSNNSTSQVILGYPLSVSTSSPPVNYYEDGDPTGTAVRIRAGGAGNIILVVNVYNTDIYEIGSASAQVTCQNWSGYDATGSTNVNFTSTAGFARRIVAFAGTSIRTGYYTSVANNPLAVSTSSTNLPTGGTITLRSDGLRVHRITATSTTAFTIPAGYKPSSASDDSSYYIWLVGGGGGGGADGGVLAGTGGGGGVYYARAREYYSYSTLSSGNYQIVIGGGGTGGNGGNGGNGGYTSFSWSNASGISTIRAEGGGGGGYGAPSSGLAGGSGGGAGAGDGDRGASGGGTIGGSYTIRDATSLADMANVGNAGGSTDYNTGPGGGGGAGGPGGDGYSGPGKDIYGVTYAAGGGGSGANTGNGGGRGGVGGSGGSGIVIIAYYP